MAFYLPVLSALVIGAGIAQGAIALAIAVAAVLIVLYLALKHGTHHLEAVLEQGLASRCCSACSASRCSSPASPPQVQVSSAVGAFLVGIALSGQVAHAAVLVLTPLRDLFAAFFFVFFGLSTNPADIPPVLLPALILAIVTMATKTLTGYLAGQARRHRNSRSLAHRLRAHPARRVLDRHREPRRRGGSRATARAARDDLRAHHGHRRTAAHPHPRCDVVQELGQEAASSRPALAAPTG